MLTEYISTNYGCRKQFDFQYTQYICPLSSLFLLNTMRYIIVASHIVVLCCFERSVSFSTPPSLSKDPRTTHKQSYRPSPLASTRYNYGQPTKPSHHHGTAVVVAVVRVDDDPTIAGTTTVTTTKDDRIVLLDEALRAFNSSSASTLLQEMRTLREDAVVVRRPIRCWMIFSSKVRTKISPRGRNYVFWHDIRNGHGSRRYDGRSRR
jgi:hypothetical protein